MSKPVSTLAGATAEDGHFIRVADRGLVGQITLRGDLLSPTLQGAVYDLTGAPVPGIWGVNLGSAGRRVVWMSPDELLILLGYDDVADAIATLEQQFAGEHHLALDVSDARAVILLEGAEVAEVLMKGMPVDFRDHAFGVGLSRRSQLGGVAVGVWRLGPEKWELVCFRSYAGHVFDWLAASSVEGSQVALG